MDSTSVKGDRIEGQGRKGVANRKEAPEEEISSLRLIRLSESMDRILESFRASWLSRLLSFFLAKKQVSRENTGDNGRPPVKLGSFKRLGGIVDAQRVSSFLPTYCYTSVACLFPPFPVPRPNNAVVTI